jgi:hypothetical protein
MVVNAIIFLVYNNKGVNFQISGYEIYYYPCLLRISVS